MFRLIALVGAPILALILLETLLSFSGKRYPTSFVIEKEYSGELYLVDNPKFTWRFFPEHLARMPQPIRVLKDKPAGLKRILVFGGSAAMGDPNAAFGMPRVLQVVLSERYPETRFEVINCAMTAINSHVVREMARDCVALNADAWVIYMGNNEVYGPFGPGTVFGPQAPALPLVRANLMLKKTNTGQWMQQLLSGKQTGPRQWGGLQMFLDQTIRENDPSLERVYSNFSGNIEAIYSSADDVPIIASSVVCNLASFSPFVADRSHPNEEQETDVQELLEEVSRLIEKKEYEEALKKLDGLDRLGSESKNALVLFCRGQCLLGLAKVPEAKEMFLKAKDADTLRFRADTPLNEIIKDRSGAFPNVSFIEMDEIMGKMQPEKQPIPGDEYFFEHVHLTFRGNYVLARAFASELAKKLNLPASEKPWPSERDCEAFLGMSPLHHEQNLLEVAERISVPPFSGRLGNDARIEALKKKAKNYRSQLSPKRLTEWEEVYVFLIKQYPHDWQIKRQAGVFYQLAGKPGAAIPLFEEVAEALPESAIADFELGKVLMEAGEFHRGLAPLKSALDIRAGFTEAHVALAKCHAELGQIELSQASYSKAIELNPRKAETYLQCAGMLKTAGKIDGSIEVLEDLVELRPDLVLAHQQFGEGFVKLADFAKAKHHYSKVAQLLPAEVSAMINLGLVELRLGDTVAALAQFERALQLDPENELALRYAENLR